MLQYFAFRRCKYIVSCSNSIKKILLIKNLRSKTINNGISIDDETILKTKHHKNFNNFITVGNINKRKNLIFLLEVFNKYLLFNKNASLTVIGDGPELYSLKKNYQSSNIFFVGKKNNVLDYFKSASVFLSSSFSEGLPNSVLEALSNHLLCLISNISSHQDLKKDFTNSIHLFSLNDEGKELLDLLLNVEKFMNYLSFDNFVNLKFYSSKFMANQYSTLYKNLLNHKKFQ